MQLGLFLFICVFSLFANWALKKIGMPTDIRVLVVSLLTFFMGVYISQ